MRRAASYYSISERDLHMEERLYGIPPAADENARLMILGSMPGARSLMEGQYYAYPRNDFWALLCAALGADDPADYDARIALAKSRGVALWDVIASCVREGSLDQNIRDAVPNDIPGFLGAHPGIRAVCFNGTAARRAFQKHFAEREGIDFLLLPSSSPVPRQAIRGFTDKLPYWMKLREYLAN